MTFVKNIITQEYLDPTIGRSIRETLAFALPILWGMLTGDMTVLWIAIGAQVCAMVDIDGSFPLRISIISITIISCAFTGMLGTLAGNNWILATGIMFILAFIGGFVRQSGTHGIGMAIGALLIYLLALESPGNFVFSLHTFLNTMIGGCLALIMAVISWFYTPFSSIKRTVSNTWMAMADWIALFPPLLEEKRDEDHPTLIDEKELNFREALDKSILVLSREQGIAHAKKNKLSFQLVELRKIISFINPAVSSFQDTLSNLKEDEDFPNNIIKYILENLSLAIRRIAIYIASGRSEYLYLAKLNIKRLKNNKVILLEHLPNKNSYYLKQPSFQSLQEIINYLEEATAILDEMYSKSRRITLFMHNLATGMTIPQKFPVVRFQLNFQSFAFRYALRVALTMAIGIAVYEYFHIPHGYWIAMTSMIILQPDYGATYKKAYRRIIGTISGATVGFLLFLVPMPYYISFFIVTGSAFFMSFYMKKRYGFAAFFITLMVIALYHLIEPTSWELGLIRILNTLFGAGLAIVGGYAFFPLWEQKKTPTLFEKAIQSNIAYLNVLLSIPQTVSDHSNIDLVSPRREAEVSNFNAFQSLNKMKEEPSKKRSRLQLYYVIIGFNIRLTRLLKTLNQELKEIPNIAPERLEDFKNKLINILEDSAERITMKNPPASSFSSLPESFDIDELNDTIEPLKQIEAEEQITIKKLYERIAKQVIGLHYSVYQIKPTNTREKVIP